MKLVYVLTIVRHSLERDYIDFFRSCDVKILMRSTGYGLTDNIKSKRLGTDEREKVAFFTIMSLEKAKSLLKIFDTTLHLSRPGVGISFAVPITSMTGRKSYCELCEDEVKQIDKEEELDMKHEFDHEVIVAIANRGHADTIMDVAKEHGAKGGTIIHSLDKTIKDKGKFLGVSVSNEKDIILIVIEQEFKKSVMQAIAREAGSHSAVNAVVFSMPVTGVAGLLD